MRRVNESEVRGRMVRLQALLEREGLSALIVFDPRNIRYLSGFTGEDACLVVGPEEPLLLCDFRFRLQAVAEAPVARFAEVEHRLVDELPRVLAGIQGEVGLESTFLTLSRWLVLEKSLCAAGVAFRAAGGLVEELRRVKSAEEQRLCREAGELVAAAMAQLLHTKVVGRSEADVALDLELWARRHGSEPVPFPFIVASGVRSAMPHGVASRTIIPEASLLLVDIGVTVEGYASDMTRTFATGGLSGRERDVYEVVREAQRVGRSALGPGRMAAEVDAAARKVIEDAGFARQFGHSLGHGVGLDVHEAPRLAPKSEDILVAGNVVTVEPGIYVEDMGGVRIEDTVVVTEAGPLVLTEFPRELMQVY